MSSETLARREALAEENLSRVVWQLAWPAVLTMLLQLANGLVDMFFVGRLGPAAQAAVGMGGQVVMLLIDRKSTRLNSSHIQKSRMPSSA